MKKRQKQSLRETAADQRDVTADERDRRADDRDDRAEERARRADVRDELADKRAGRTDPPETAGADESSEVVDMLVSAANLRDARADARDVEADRRDDGVAFDSALFGPSEEGHAQSTQLLARQLARQDRKHAESDRLASRMDRSLFFGADVDPEASANDRPDEEQ